MKKNVALLIFLGLVRWAEAKKSAKDWSKIDLDKVDEEWKSDDSEDELITEDELLHRQMEERRNNPPPLDWDAIERGEGNVDQLKHTQSAAGPAMMFIDLKPPGGGTDVWTQDDVTTLATQWKDLLISGGQRGEFYPIGDNQLLVSTQKGWEASAIRDFLLEQPQVVKVRWDSSDYYPEGVEPPEKAPSPPEAGPLPSSKEEKKTTKKSKKKKKKAKQSPPTGDL